MYDDIIWIYSFSGTYLLPKFKLVFNQWDINSDIKPVPKQIKFARAIVKEFHVQSSARSEMTYN